MMSNVVRVLLAEDDAGDAEVVKRLLSKSTRSRFDIEWAETLESAARALSSAPFDVLLLDLGLPRIHGLEGLAKIQGASARVPIVIVTDQNDESLALRALQDGAQDYLIKGSLTTDNLVRSIRYATQRHTLVRHLADAQIILENKSKRLAKLYRAAHKFVDNVSREFRTPLRLIRESVSLMHDGLVGDVSNEQRQVLTDVQDRADDLNAMVDDMLDINRLKAGLLTVYRKQCKATDIVARVRTALERKAAAKSVQLEWDIDGDLPLLYCDPEKAERVLINLTINALKLCGPSGHVRLSCRKRQDPSGVEFSVSDNGPGVSAKNQRAILRRFKQLGKSVRGSTKFDLGLRIAKELVDLNLGEIRVESGPGRGRTFSFTLPPADSAEVLRRYLHRLGLMRNGPPYLSLVQTDVAGELTDDVDGILSGFLRYNDLLLRVGPRRWLIVLPVCEREIPAFCQRAERAFREANCNCLEDPFPMIHFQFLGTWRVDGHEEVLARLRAIVDTEELVYA